MVILSFLHIMSDISHPNTFHTVDKMTKKMKRKYVNLLHFAHSQQNRKQFLLRCIEEKVIPASTPAIFKTSKHIFPKYVQNYLEESAENLRLQHSSTSTKARNLEQILQNSYHITKTEIKRLKLYSYQKSHTQFTKLNRKITTLCAKSKWTTLGRNSIIENLSSITLNNTEKEALGLGLKFSTGLKNQQITDIVAQNYNSSDSDFYKGYVQGIIIATTQTLPETTIPKRFIIALNKLSKNKDLIITPSDKGGGVVLMDRTTYTSKMNSLLQDEDVYTKINIQTIHKEIDKFNKAYTKLVGKKNKSWSLLVDHHPKIPLMYGLPKTHKPNTPMRPIISNIGSAPHKIAKAIASILNPLLGTISPAHIINSGDLITKLNKINSKNMRLASLDIKSLYTNVPVNKCLNLLSAHLKRSNTPPPLPCHNYNEDMQ